MRLYMLPGVEPVYGALRATLVLPVRVAMRWTVDGAHLIPVHGPVILASNHVSYLDPLALGYLADRRHRRVRFLAKRELFEKHAMGVVLRHAHQIPVARDTALAAGECVGVFPEGTISLDLEPMAGKTGTARLAAASGVPVTPVGLWGAQRILFKGRKPRWRWGVAESVVVGDPVAVAAGDDVREGTDRIMRAVAACVAQARARYPQRPRPGEGDWWVRGPDTVAAHQPGGASW